MHFSDDDAGHASCHAMAYAPSYPPHGFSDHGPMALFALERLGAGAEARRRFESRYVRRLASPDPQTDIAITGGNFYHCLGREQAYLGFFRYFLGRVGEEDPVPGIDVLLPGISTAAFHALIRIAYGLEAGRKAEVAAGLAYLADAYRPFANGRGAVDKGSRYRDIYNELVESGAVHALKLPVLQGDIHQRMCQVAEDPLAGLWVARAGAADALSLEEIASCNLDFFLRTGNFTALHMVTAAHAARIVAPHVLQGREFLAAMAEASIAALLTVPADAIGRAHDSGPPPPAGDIAAMARQSHDEHDIKMAYSCIGEHGHYGWPGYLFAARRRLERG